MDQRYESVVTLLSLDGHDVKYQCFAPDIRSHVVNHLTGAVVEGESRNVLIEAARLAREIYAAWLNWLLKTTTQ